MSKLKKNVIFQITYQLLILIVPLITAPYVSRVLLPESIGVYSYTLSISNYFVIFAMLGLNTYGNRTISMCRDDKDELNKTFSSIFYLHLIVSFITIVAYLLFCIFIENNSIYYWICFLYVIGALLDINWLYFGLEDIKNIVLKNLLIKIGSTILIFIVVKNNNDLWKYILILAGSSVLGQLILWVNIYKKVRFTKPNTKEILKHLKPMLILFVPIIAINLYKYMDKIMLGVMSSYENVGLYENSEKIANVPVSIVNAIGLVMLPFSSYLASKNRFDELKQNIQKTLNIVIPISYFLMFGLAAISIEFAPIYFGEDYRECGVLIMGLSFTLIFLSISNVIRTQYLMPLKKDLIFIISLFIGAILNVIFNALLIPYLGALGAVFGTIVAESSVCISQLILVRKEVKIRKPFIKSIPFLLISIIMFIFVRVIGIQFGTSKYILLFQIAVGVLVVFLLTIIYSIFIDDSIILEMCLILKFKRFAYRLSKVFDKIHRLKDKKYAKEYYHLSIDDVHLCLENLQRNYDIYLSIFDEPFLMFLKDMHLKYNVTITLNINSADYLNNIGSKFQEEFKKNKWLKFSFYSVNGKKNNDKDDILEYYQLFFNEVETITGSNDSIDSFIQLNEFRSNKIQLKDIQSCFKVAFLGPGDDRNVYYFDDKFSKLLKNNRTLEIDNIIFLEINLRLDDFFVKDINGNYKYLNSVNKEISRIESNTLICFTHEYLIYNGKKMKYEKKLFEDTCSFINDNCLKELSLKEIEGEIYESNNKKKNS